MSPVIFVQNLETLKKLADDYLVVLLFQFSSDLRKEDRVVTFKPSMEMNIDI